MEQPSPQTGAQKEVIDEKNTEQTVTHLSQVDSNGFQPPAKPEVAVDSVGLALVDQVEVIPITGKRRTTTKWEYMAFCLFYFSNNGAPIAQDGGAIRQALLSQRWPSGYVTWGGETLPMNSYLLDLTGILFAVQLVLLLTIGPFADYGNWRPWIMIFFQTIVYVTQFAFIGVYRPSQWQGAQALYILGNVAYNIVTAFYQATFPGLVRDLPKMLESEAEVKAGIKSPEDHVKLDMWERSKLYNWCNIVGSATVAIFYAIAVGITAGVGYKTTAQQILSYRVLMGYFGAICMACTVPFFVLQKHRPGMQLPAGTRFWNIGFIQVWSAMKKVRKLKHCMLYLLAYFMLNETFGTSGNLVQVLQNEVVNYSPILVNALSLCSCLGGGTGTVACLWLQYKYRFSVKSGALYGAAMTLFPSLWGGIGYFTNKIGFHHVWEFWMIQFWNFQTAAWGSYSITMISEVVPAPKAYLFFALFNTVGQTSGFVGPFISSAIIKRANGDTNACFWFLFGMGLLGVIALYFVDPNQAKLDNAELLAREASELYSEQQRADNKENNPGDDVLPGVEMVTEARMKE